MSLREWSKCDTNKWQVQLGQLEEQFTIVRLKIDDRSGHFRYLMSSNHLVLSKYPVAIGLSCLAFAMKGTSIDMVVLKRVEDRFISIIPIIPVVKEWFVEHNFFECCLFELRRCRDRKSATICSLPGL
jgi:hypothetical protein